jgi:hypothetical protein
MVNKKSLGLLCAAVLNACGGGSTPAPVQATQPQPPVVVEPPPVVYPVLVDVRGLPAGTQIEVRNGADTKVVVNDGVLEFPTRYKTGSTYSVSLREGPFVTCQSDSPEGVVTAVSVPVRINCAESRKTPELVEYGRVADVTIPGFMGYFVGASSNTVSMYSVVGDWLASSFGAAYKFSFSATSSVAHTRSGQVAVTDTCNGVLRLLDSDGAVLAGQMQDQCSPEGRAVAPMDGDGKSALLDLPGPLAGSQTDDSWILAGAAPNLLRRVSATGQVSSIHLLPAVGTALPGKIRSIAIAPDETTIFVSGDGGVWKVVGDKAALLAPLKDAGKLYRTSDKVFVMGDGAIFELSPEGSLKFKEQSPTTTRFAVIPPILIPSEKVIGGGIGPLNVFAAGAQPAVNSVGELLAVNPATGIVYRYVNSYASGFIYNEIVVGKGFVLPQTLANNAAGEVIVLDRISPTRFAIKSADNARVWFTADGDGTAAQLAFGPDGMMAVSLPAERSVRLYRSDGSLLNSVVGIAPGGLAFDGGGALYFYDRATFCIMRTGATGAPAKVACLAAGDERLQRSMAIDATGNIYLTGWQGVTRVRPGGEQTNPQFNWGSIRVTGLSSRNGYLYGTKDGVVPIRHKLVE